MSKRPLDEAAMQAMEQHIPELASSAVTQAYYRALTLNGSVLEARDGLLVEVSANGSTRVIREIASPIPVTPGSRRVRARKA